MDDIKQEQIFFLKLKILIKKAMQVSFKEQKQINDIGHKHNQAK